MGCICIKEIMGEMYLVVLTGRETLRINLNDILYFEKELRKIHVKTVLSQYIFYGTFRELLKIIDKRFCRCHNSFIVNMDKIVRIQRLTIELEGGELLPISQRKYRNTRDQYSVYLHEIFSCKPGVDIV